MNIKKFSQKLSKRLTSLVIKNRDFTMQYGVGKGLKFNAGKSNPETALGSYELPVQQALANYLKSGDVFYDIGANVGFFTILAAKLVGSSGQVHAFEPDRSNSDRVRHNLQLNNFTNTTVWQKAVCDTTGTGKLLLAEYSGGHTLSVADTPPDLAGSIIVETVSIDDLIDRGQLPPPNVVKIDVEGAELDVLQGMLQTIKQYQPMIIYEVDAAQSDYFQQKNESIASLINSLNYKNVPLKNSYQEINWHVGHAIAIPNQV